MVTLIGCFILFNERVDSSGKRPKQRSIMTVLEVVSVKIPKDRTVNVSSRHIRQNWPATTFSVLDFKKESIVSLDSQPNVTDLTGIEFQKLQKIGFSNIRLREFRECHTTDRCFLRRRPNVIWNQNGEVPSPEANSLGRWNWICNHARAQTTLLLNRANKAATIKRSNN